MFDKPLNTQQQAAAEHLLAMPVAEMAALILPAALADGRLTG